MGARLVKYFIVSDIHSYYKPLLKSLKAAGFDKKNPEHTLIVCGDVFDRGDETLKVYKFLKSIPKKRIVLIRGNHESLYLDLLDKSYPEEHDFSNGTVWTFCQIVEEGLETLYDLRQGYRLVLARQFGFVDKGMTAYSVDLWEKIQTQVKNSEITKWLQGSQWLNFYELDKYIFVHSFIPLTWNDKYYGKLEARYIYEGVTEAFLEKEDWRNATDEEWAKASWGCPYKFFDAGLFDQEIKKDKVLVCGHYRCSEFNKHYLSEEDNHNIYFGHNLIAIDATTALSNQTNVLVIDFDGNTQN